MATYDMLRYYTFANCWHMNESQSMALWETYSEKGKEIAIESTIEDYGNSINIQTMPGSLSAGKVE